MGGRLFSWIGGGSSTIGGFGTYVSAQDWRSYLTNELNPLHLPAEYLDRELRH
jgi:hypothetical protein